MVEMETVGVTATKLSIAPLFSPNDQRWGGTGTGQGRGRDGNGFIRSSRRRFRSGLERALLSWDWSSRETCFVPGLLN